MIQPRCSSIAAKVRHGVRGAETQDRALGADAPAFPDERPGDVDALGGQVLAEHPVGEGAIQLGLPVVEVFARVDVDGLIVAPWNFGLPIASPASPLPVLPGAWTMTASAVGTL